MSLALIIKRFLIVICVASCLCLSGCKIPAEIVEGIAQFLSRATGQIVGRIINDKFSEKADQEKRTPTLPFPLLRGDTYHKVEPKDGMDAYYVVTNKDGTIKHYSLDGELQWSNIEAEDLEDNPDLSKSSSIISPDVNSTEEMEIHTEILPLTSEYNNQIHVNENHYLVITSLSNQPIRIQNVLLNRGYCTGNWSFGSPRILNHYSASSKVILNNCKVSDLHEIEITTTKDHYFYEF
ncbi:hypothetical protein [Acinetobacter baylyi]|uniref:hypothetical protein n=1 Tax=Acinetobacter baylyi TaxID=202950 RepID=UPI000EA1634B|nr:hypothetical protein [Acinetobacter baylyi]